MGHCFVGLGLRCYVQVLRTPWKGHLIVAYVFTDFHITSYSGFQVKQSVVAVLMFWEQYFLLCSGERMASISVLPVYESLNFPLVCVFACIVWLVFIMVKLTMGYTKITRLQQRGRGLSNSNEVETLSKITLSNSFSLTDFTFICTNKTFLLNLCTGIYSVLI